MCTLFVLAQHSRPGWFGVRIALDGVRIALDKMGRRTFVDIDVPKLLFSNIREERDLLLVFISVVS